MNEVEFNLLVKDDLDNLNHLVFNGYFETDDFKNAVSKLANSLAFLSQEIEQCT